MSKPAERWQSKWQARASVARPDYEFGVQNPSRNPIDAAIAKRKDFEQKMQSKETFDKWEAGLRFTGLDGWQKAAMEKGAPRYTAGIEAGAGKYADFSNKFKAHLDTELPKIRAMSKATIDQAVAKAAAMIKANAKFRYKK